MLHGLLVVQATEVLFAERRCKLMEFCHELYQLIRRWKIHFGGGAHVEFYAIASAQQYRFAIAKLVT